MQNIEIVDRGRGLQLSTSRITVQDLVPYFQEECSDNEIIRWIPTLTPEEIAVVRRYYAEHRAEFDEEERLIKEGANDRKNPDWVEEIGNKARGERLAKMDRLGEKRNGAAR